MKRISLATVFIALISTLVPTQVRAEAPIIRNNNGCQSGNIAVRPIEDARVITKVTGRVVAIEYNKQPGVAAKNMVMWLRLKTATGEEVPIYLGSSWYLNQKHFQIQPQDLLTIQVTKPVGAKKTMTIASTIEKGDRVWTASIPNKPTPPKSCKPL
jgi:hypothetical protein